MSDDFEKAVLFTFDQTGGVSPELRAQAQAMLQTAVASPDAWQLCVSRLETSGYAEVKFWCLQTLHALARSLGYSSLDPSARAQIKRSLIVLGTQPSSGLPAFLRNKIAQTIVAIAAQEYPNEWPGFFQDVLGTLSSGPDAVDLFCRILVSVDEDIISLDVPRSAGEAKQSMHFKDSMRERALGDISTAWAQLISAYKDSSPDLAAAVLDAAQRYVHWIDISLVANETFVPLLFSVLNSAAEAPRAAAAGVLTEIIEKRMESLPKLNLIQSLGVVPVCAQWANGLPGAEEEPELAANYAKLLAALATEVLEAWKKVENSVLSMAAVGLDVGEEAGAEASAACGAAAQLLDALFPAVLTALRMANDEIATAVVPFVISYISRVRMLQKRANGVVPPQVIGQLPAILEATAACARFSDDSMVYAIAPASPGEKVAAEEEETAISDRRQELFVLFKNTSKLAPEEAYSIVGRRLEAALPRAYSETTWQDAEIAISLLFHLGEVATEDALRLGTGQLAALAAGVIQAEVPASQHRLVALALLETCVRYAKVIAQQAGTLMEPAVGLFLGPRGLGHPSAAVPPRAAFLFCRLVKYLRQQLQPVAGSLLATLSPHLAAIAASPMTSLTESTGKAAGASSILGALGTGISAADDRLYAFEAAGWLIGVEALPEKQQLDWLLQVLQPLVSQIEANTVADPPLGAVQLLQQAFDALTRASKGFALRLCTSRPEVGALLAKPVNPALRALQRFPAHKPLRSKFMAYIHRLVECLGPAMVPHLSGVLWTLHQAGGDAADACDPLNLLSQVVTKHKTQELTTLVATSLPESVAKVHLLLGQDWDWSGVAAQPAMSSSPATARLSGPAVAGSTEDLRERGELQRAYYSFLANLIAADMSRVLLAAPGETLSHALHDLMQGAATHVDATVRKLCISALGKIATDTLTNDGGGGSGQEAAGVDGSGGVAAASGTLPTATTPTKTASLGEASNATSNTRTATLEPTLNALPSSPPIGVPPIRGGSAALGGLEDFLLQRFGCEVLLGGLANPDSTVDVRDASCISLLSEIATQLKSMHRLGGSLYLSHLFGVTLPRLGWPQAAQEQLVGHISQSETKQLKDFLKQAFIELRQPNGAAAAAAGVGNSSGHPVFLGSTARRV
ncbi:hypothetical protein Ndes2526B_g07998 [Nannochloris sp. 'desiccata']|nr:hypothetical protein KSW81_002642 [Chlorella desiccata (nom. nud.)]KAH7617396.1 putative Exportin-T [Chlorella desiccata (nom. nud.)]